MKMKAKKLAMLSLVIAALAPCNVQASQVTIPQSAEPKSIVSTRVEDTKYYYKEIRGRMYKRLWSITYNHWIDDMWYPC